MNLLDEYERQKFENEHLKERYYSTLDELDLTKKQLEKAQNNDNKKFLSTSLRGKKIFLNFFFKLKNVVTVNFTKRKKRLLNKKFNIWKNNSRIKKTSLSMLDFFKRNLKQKIG